MQFGPEDRRLKAGGIAFAIGGAAPLAWLANTLSASWPPPREQLALLLVALVVGVNLLAAGLLMLSAGFGAVRAFTHPRRRRAVALQLLLANLLAPVLLAASVLDEAGPKKALEGTGVDVAIALVAYGFAFASWRLWRRSQRLDAPSADEAMAADPRPPVLYLRSFHDDGVPLLALETSRWGRRVSELIRLATPEQHTADLLGQLGPVVAIGKPGEPLPELGAARLYVEHDAWRETVTALMRRARLITVRIGASPGVLWEIEQALELVPRERVVFALVGGTTAPEVASRLERVLGSAWDAAQPEPARIPPWWQRWLPRLDRFQRRIGALVCFPDGRSAVCVPVQRWRPLPGQWLVVSPIWRVATNPLRRAWREVFDRLGLAPAHDAHGKSRVIATLLAIFLGGFGAHWFYLGRRRRGWLYVLGMPLLLLSLYAAWFDALRFLWVDRSEFERRFTR